MKFISFLFLIWGCYCANATEFYVSPTGTTTGNGSINAPWNLQTALNQPATVKAGDTIWLRGGNYKGSFTSKLVGTDVSPIKVKQYSGERATIDGAGAQFSLTVNSSYVWYMDFEVASSYTNRVSQFTGPWPADLPYGAGIWSQNGTANKFINLIVHDNPQGFALWAGTTNTEVYGCLVYFNGWDAPDRSHGHGFYVQDAAPSKKFILNTICFNNASGGLQYYGTDSIQLQGAVVANSIWFDTGVLFQHQGGQNFLLGGMGVSTGLIASNNCIARNHGDSGNSDFYIGYTGGVSNSFIVNNYVATTSLWTLKGTNTITGNTFLATNPYNGINQSVYPSNVWATTRPTTGSVIKITNNLYDSQRWQLAIYNWSKAATVVISPPAGLEVGDRIVLCNVQDFYNDRVTGTVSSLGITIPMTNHTVAKPSGISSPPSTFPVFGAFIIQSIKNPVIAAPLAPSNLTVTN